MGLIGSLAILVEPSRVLTIVEATGASWSPGLRSDVNGLDSLSSGRLSGDMLMVADGGQSTVSESGVLTRVGSGCQR